MSDVVDEWNLSWIGQMMEQKDYDMGWMGMPIDKVMILIFLKTYKDMSSLHPIY